MALDANSLTTRAQLKAYLGITSTTDDTLLDDIINRASAWIERYTRRKFIKRRYYEVRDTHGHPRIALYNYPVTICRFIGVGWNSVMSVQANTALSFASVSVNDTSIVLYKVDADGVETTSTANFANHQVSNELCTHINTISGFTAVPLLNVPSVYLRKLSGRDLRTATAFLEAPIQSIGDYQIDSEKGILYGDTMRGHRSVLVDYEAGYDTVPYDIEYACHLICSRIYNERKRDPNLNAESLGGYSYTMKASTDIDLQVRSLLDGWRRYSA